MGRWIVAQGIEISTNKKENGTARAIVPAVDSTFSLNKTSLDPSYNRLTYLNEATRLNLLTPAETAQYQQALTEIGKIDRISTLRQNLNPWSEESKLTVDSRQKAGANARLEEAITTAKLKVFSAHRAEIIENATKSGGETPELLKLNSSEILNSQEEGELLIKIHDATVLQNRYGAKPKSGPILPAKK